MIRQISVNKQEEEISILRKKCSKTRKIRGLEYYIY